MKERKFKLGDKVSFEKEVGLGTCYSLHSREQPVLGQRYRVYKNKNKLAGIVCGVRNIWWRGISEWVGHEEGYAFKPYESKQVYLIATNMKEFHKVLPGDLEAAE